MQPCMSYNSMTGKKTAFTATT